MFNIAKIGSLLYTHGLLLNNDLAFTENNISYIAVTLVLNCLLGFLLWTCIIWKCCQCNMKLISSESVFCSSSSCKLSALCLLMECNLKIVIFRGHIKQIQGVQMHVLERVCVCVCEAQVKVAPASSCVSGRIDHLIQIKDSPSARGRDELVNQCKIETYGRCRALVSDQELPLLAASLPHRGTTSVILLLSSLLHQNIHFSLCFL